MLASNMTFVREELQALGVEPECTLYEQIEVFERALPPSTRFGDDLWDVLSWERVPRGSNVMRIKFSEFRNPTLKVLTKLFVLYRRIHKQTGGSSAVQLTHALLRLDKVCLPEWRLPRLTNHSFEEAQGLLIDTFPPDSTTAYSYARYLEAFGAHLHQVFGLSISFQCSIPRPRPAGQDGTPEKRALRLVSDEVIYALLALRGRSDLSLKDEFCIHMLMILVATGFRIGELLTLAYDCLHEVNGTLSVHYYSIKRGQMDLKPVTAVLAPAVRTAFRRIREITAPGREAAQAFRMAEQTESQPLHWDLILSDERAKAYFLGQVLHRWLSDPKHLLFQQNEAWWDQEKKYVDVVTMLADAGGNASEVARQLQTSHGKVRHLAELQQAAQQGSLPIAASTSERIVSFHKDSRVVSVSAVTKMLGFRGSSSRIRGMIEQAREMQLRGELYPEPVFDEELENRSRRQSQALIRDGEHRHLEPWDALFVVGPETFGWVSPTANDGYQLIVHDFLLKTLSGRDQRLGSIFERFQITDPKTGRTAKMTSNQLRHWLNTMYLKGGLTHEQTALIMGHGADLNVQYDQRDPLEREQELQRAVRSGTAIGYISEIYISLADHDLHQAEEFLKASLRRYTIMPHGACIRDLRLDPCPNHLACFADQSTEEMGTCPDLVIDSDQPDIRGNLERLALSQDAMLTMIAPGGPQHERAKIIKRNVHKEIDRLDLIYALS